ncbi:MAG TPA: phosphoribosyltransferase [Verrucomicrobiae bacterium]|nr:phosphoribosyltransferase [Verrucomicrobiae bacterium]
MIVPEYISPAFLRLHGSYLADLEAQIARLDAGIVRSASCYVLVLSFAAHEALRSEEATRWRAAILKRAQQKPVLALSLTENGGAVSVGRMDAEQLLPLEDPELVAHLRNCELSQIVHDGSQRCLLKAPAGYHLVTPSGLHCSLFLRVANAASCLDELDAMARWVAPEIADAGAVLADNWNICPPILRAVGFARRPDVHFDFFRGHTRSDVLAARDVVDRALSRKGDGGVLLVLSVGGAGTFAADVGRMCEEAGYKGSFKTVCLYKFKDSSPQIPALCALELNAGYSAPDACDNCKQQSKIISVDPNVYYLREYVEQEVVLQKAHFAGPATVVSKYADCTGAFSVHRDDPNDGRHHALYIDVHRLLQSAEFRTHWRRFLATYQGEVDLAVVPPHEAGRQLGQLATEELGVPLIVHDNLRPGEGLSHDDCGRIRAARKLLILDDVLMSGSRLDAYNKALRENEATFGSFDSVHYLVAIARPESEIAWKRAETSLTKHAPWNASLTSAERIYLPFWDGKRCPWCLEYDFLSRWSNKLAEPPVWLRHRQHELTDKGQGITGEPLLLLPPSVPTTLGVGALAGSPGLSSIRTLFSVMAAVQGLRNEPDEQKRLWRSILAANVFKPVNFTNYSEGLIRAALLRSLTVAELGQHARTESNEILLAGLAHGDQQIILGELLFATFRNALPKTPEATIVASARGQISEDALLLLRDMLSA